jgi:Glycosyl hydrolase family 67 C-terminus
MRLIGLAVALALSLAIALLAAEAQEPGKVYRIGFLQAGSASDASLRLEAFRQGLRERGWIEGQNVVIEYRWGEGRYDRLPDLSAELVAPVLAALVTLDSPSISPLAVRGWIVSSPDRAYLERVVEAAPRYGINHLELSHDIIMAVTDTVPSAERIRLIEKVAQAAIRRGVKTYIWSHELGVAQTALNLDPYSTAGAAFWEGRRAAYRKVLRACPTLAGVVLMFASAPTRIWRSPPRGAFWKGLSMPKRARFVTDEVKSVVVHEFKKELFVRDFNHSPAELKWLIAALRNDPEITVVSKAAPQDFQPFYPHSFSLGAYGTTRQVVELDLDGEYWGRSLIPSSQVGYLRYRLRHGVSKHIAGAVGRIGPDAAATPAFPNEINLYAFSRLLEDPELSEQRIYDEWLDMRYGLAVDSQAARRLQEILVRSFDMCKKTYYTLGFWLWKDQSSVPRTVQEIERGISHKSNAIWEPSPHARAMEQRLIRPDEATVGAILAEKREGVELADQNLSALATLRHLVSAQDYAELERQLALAADLARVYEAVASAYWRRKLAQTSVKTTEVALVEAATQALESWADILERRYPALEPVALQAPVLRHFAKDLRRSMPMPRASRLLLPWRW